MDQNTQIINPSAIPTDDVLFIALELGEHILRSGGEITRAEDTITRICKAYGATHVDVTAIFSMIVLTVDFHEARSTCTRRLKNSSSTNLNRLAKLNDLSRTICATLPDKDTVVKKMSEISSHTVIKLPIYMIGNMLAALGFAIFFSNLKNGFSGDVILGIAADAVMSGLIALPLCLIYMWMDKTQISPIISKFAVCFIGGMSALLIERAMPICSANIIMIGNIMNFIPGVAMTNSFRDLFGGEIMSGLFRLCSVIIDAIVIAAGYAVAILILGGVA